MCLKSLLFKSTLLQLQTERSQLFSSSANFHRSFIGSELRDTEQGVYRSSMRVCSGWEELAPPIFNLKQKGSKRPRARQTSKREFSSRAFRSGTLSPLSTSPLLFFDGTLLQLLPGERSPARRRSSARNSLEVVAPGYAPLA